MRRRPGTCILLFLLFGCMLSIVGDEQAGEDETAEDQNEPVQLGEIVVRGQAVGEVDQVITRDEIAKAQSSRTVDNLLKSMAGIDITRTSPGGDAGSGAVSLRGFDESRFLILLDGRPLNGSGVYGGDYVDWASLSTESTSSSTSPTGRPARPAMTRASSRSRVR